MINSANFLQSIHTLESPFAQKEPVPLSELPIIFQNFRTNEGDLNRFVYGRLGYYYIGLSSNPESWRLNPESDTKYSDFNMNKGIFIYQRSGDTLIPIFLGGLDFGIARPYYENSLTKPVVLIRQLQGAKIDRVGDTVLDFFRVVDPYGLILDFLKLLVQDMHETDFYAGISTSLRKEARFKGNKLMQLAYKKGFNTAGSFYDNLNNLPDKLSLKRSKRECYVLGDNEM